MLACYVHTTNELAWRDAARRLHHARLVVERAGAEPVEAEVFDGAALARPAALRAALDAGRHVLIAAEPCLPREPLVALRKAASAQGLVFGVLNPDRFTSARQLMRKQLGAALGSPELVRSHRWENHAAEAPLGLPGPLVGELEQAAWFYGRPIRTVFALRPAGLNAVQVQLGFEPGLATILFCDALHGTTAGGYRALSIIGSRGSTQLDDHTNTQLAYLGGDGPTGLTVDEGVRPRATLLDDFAAAVAAQRDLSATVADALHAIDVVAAVQKSLAGGEAVAVESRP